MVKLKVGGMTCAHCAAAVKNALSGVPGVVKVVGVSLDRGEAVVEGQPDPKALIAAVEAEGYRAEAA